MKLDSPDQPFQIGSSKPMHVQLGNSPRKVAENISQGMTKITDSFFFMLGGSAGHEIGLPGPAVPYYEAELEQGAVAIVMFILGQYSGNQGEMLSFNLQAAVAMHDPVTADQYPPETNAGLPRHVITTHRRIGAYVIAPAARPSRSSSAPGTYHIMTANRRVYGAPSQVTVVQSCWNQGRESQVSSEPVANAWVVHSNR
ncbi:hypothetical protein C8R45DRAFT_928636 [Mycena sanguinolenta]|nr:hypothetical protein C8R45DRAFT_928636 [Mycena sanguinolenta]